MDSSRRTRRILTSATLIALVAAVSVIGAGVAFGKAASSGTTTSIALPAMCARPQGGFLIVVSQYGYNDSILQGAGQSNPYPIIQVKQGQTVNIVVCNIDIEAHGFQVATYVESKINIIGPDKALSFSFVASQEGTFAIFCAIPCNIHIFLQYGQLRVSALTT